MNGNTDLCRTVTALQKQRGRLYMVTWDDQTTDTMYRPTWDETGYGIGSALTEREWEELYARGEQARAKEYALWLLSQRDYAAAELRRKVKDKTDAATADLVVERLTELGFLHDEQYAVRLARDLCERKHYPRRRAAETMRQKGIDRDVIETALEEIGAEDTEQALALLRKKCYTADSDEDARRKVRDFLLRYGFSYDTVREAMRAAERE